MHRCSPRPVQALLPVPGHGLLSRTPVTVSQFEPFVSSGAYARDAIAVRRHTGRGPGDDGARTCPNDWSRQLRRPSWPVTGVSWYEAAAFAAWLGSRHPAHRFSLASSSTWEAAADTDSRPYPWGHTPPNGTLLNFDREVGRRTAVTAHPQGAGRYGHLGLSGNVWEWCADRTPSGGTVRGGGWYTSAEYVKNTYRYTFHPENRFEDLGFRIQARETHKHTPPASRRNT
ncbi:formylglycine-generating enzyme family protein [Streptomyces sp. NPDC085479]|uniref:formylglycine-generating enzyme family protein n=1 Tax=Streptomyces sp. NPDC085479 TaxID=3365726 RepID=UPI0037D2683D